MFASSSSISTSSASMTMRCSLGEENDKNVISIKSFEGLKIFWGFLFQLLSFYQNVETKCVLIFLLPQLAQDATSRFFELASRFGIQP
jgi:hypothetical protein